MSMKGEFRGWPGTGKVLPRAFFERPATEVAPDLLGMALCRWMAPGKVVRHRIVEVEAYEGPEDLASHAARGRTPRNEVMFGPPGLYYVYLCYGMHWLLNVVCGPRGYPSAVLFRGIESVSGPGRLTRHLRIDGSLNRAWTGRSSGLWMESPIGLERLRRDDWVSGPRVGVGYAGPFWSTVPYRFRLTRTDG